METPASRAVAAIKFQSGYLDGRSGSSLGGEVTVQQLADIELLSRARYDKEEATICMYVSGIELSHGFA